MQAAVILVVAAPSRPRERLTGVLSAAGYQILLADTLTRAREVLAAREVALVATRLAAASAGAVAFVRDVSSRVPVLGLLDRPGALAVFTAAAVPLEDVVFAPFSDAELTARIGAALARRCAAGASSAGSATLSFSGWTLDVGEKSLTDPTGRAIQLTRAEFSLLEALARRPNRVLSRDRLLDAIAGREAAPFDRTIDNLVCRLRRKMEDDRASPRLIATVPGFGYRLNASHDQGQPFTAFVKRGSAPPQAVTVMPFNAGDAASEALATSLADDLVAELARGSNTRVLAGSIAAREAIRERGLKAVSGELDLGYVVAGNVCRDGPTLRINVHLLDAATGAHLWTERASIEQPVPTGNCRPSDRIVHALRRELRIAEGVRAEIAAELDAAQLIARGRGILLQSETPESRRKACRFFERALSLDNASVDAMAALGATLARNVVARWSADPIADQRRAEGLLRRAIRGAPAHFDANLGMGLLLRWQGRWWEAIASLQHATEIDRTDPNALIQLAIAHIFVGDSEKALPYTECAAAICGDGSTIGSAYWALGSCHLFLGNSNEALTWLLKARARNWQLPWIRLRLAAAFGKIGELDQAREELDAARLLVAPAARTEYANLAAYRSQPQFQHPEFLARGAPTLYAALGKAGMPET